MNDKEQTIQDKLDGFKVMSIDYCNYKPHPYTIGPEHVSYAADHYGGSLGKEAIKNYEKTGGRCAHTGCSLSYEEHTSDKVLFLQLMENMTNDKANEQLKAIADLLTKYGIDGIAFVESPQKYRITS